MQLADLHLDLDTALVDVIIKMIDGLEYDIAVLTGDYHNKIAQKHDKSLELMGRLALHVRDPRFAILGNHDFIEKVAFLEAIGFTVLLNEAEPIEREGVRLWICGVDDPHFFHTHDLRKARQQVPPDETAILLSHSPETASTREKLGFAFMLKGHTHGGCLPSRRICNHWKCPGSATVLGRTLATWVAARIHIARNWCEWCSSALQLSFRGDHPYATPLDRRALMQRLGLLGGPRRIASGPERVGFDFSERSVGIVLSRADGVLLEKHLVD
jgi:predicted phosphodiesterase